MKRRIYLLVKRSFDVVVAIVAIIVLLIPWSIIAIIIKMQSPGPAIYKARRVGIDGEVFTLYKFRTMNVDSGKIRATTLRCDPRIFPFGKFLRKSKLDETPQLINIIKGEMSIIGPRPEDEANAERLYLGRYKDILSVKPGLSSPASLYDYTHGELYPNEETYIKEFLPQKMDVELFYIHHRSIFYDLQIILRTVVTILQILGGKKRFEKPREVQYEKEEKNSSINGSIQQTSASNGESIL